MKNRLDCIVINSHDMEGGEVSMRAILDGGSERIFKLPIEVVLSKDFMTEAQKRAHYAPSMPNITWDISCPCCGNNKLAYFKTYKGHRFCKMCGAHLKLDLERGTAALLARTDSMV